MNFGEKLIEVRNAKGFTQEEVAEKCNVTVRTIQRIESGTVKPRAFTIKVISEALGFDFFEASDNSHDVDAKIKNSNLEKLLFYIKDLFNLKTNSMRKISILATTAFLVGFIVFISVSDTKAQSATQTEQSSVVSTDSNKDYVKTKDKIEVAFTHKLSFDNLVYIKNDLKSRRIIITYKKLEFDDKDRLLSIECNIDCKDGFKGSVSIYSLDSIKKNIRVGFYRNYSKDGKSPFGTGLLLE